MPRYDFECPRCGERFEELVHAGEAAACRRCGERETRRLFSPISGPHKWHIDRGFAAESNARRAEREAARKARFVEERKRRREQGTRGGPGGPSGA